MMSRKFLINVSIENKPAARDPEGETIFRDLIVRGGFDSVKSVRVAKLLKVIVEADSVDQARQITENMCNELRIFNPAVHICVLEARGEVH